MPKWAIVLIVLVVLGMFSSKGNKSSGNNEQVVVATQQPAIPIPIPIPTSTLEPTPEPQVNAVEMVNSGDYSLVTPEFKEWMDSYEAFYDKYIAFMLMLSEIEKWEA